MRRFLLVFDDQSFSVAEGQNLLDAIGRLVVEMPWARIKLPNLVCACELNPLSPVGKKLGKAVLRNFARQLGIKKFTD